MRNYDSECSRLVCQRVAVADASILYFMERMYKALRMGIYKSAAVCYAQPFVLAEDGWQHPAFWGAFQLIGNDISLSSNQ